MRVAVGERQVRQVDVRPEWQAKPGRDQPGGAAAPAGTPDRLQAGHGDKIGEHRTVGRVEPDRDWLVLSGGQDMVELVSCRNRAVIGREGMRTPSTSQNKNMQVPR